MWNNNKFTTKKWIELPGETFDEYMERCYSPERLAEFDSADIAELYSEWNCDGCGGLPDWEEIDVFIRVKPRKKPRRFAKVVEKVAREKAKYEWYHGKVLPDGLDDDLPFN